MIFNKDGITDDEIDMLEEIVKVLLCNSRNELLLCQDDGVLHFVGGHPEEGENIEECALREIKEETCIHGMVSLVPFLQLQEYQTNFFGTGKNGLARITYIEGITDEVFNYAVRKLDEEEAKRDFRLIYNQ